MVAIAAPPQGPGAIAPPATLMKQYAIVVPMDASEVDTEHLKTYLIPLKSHQREIQEFIQRIEQVLRERK